MPLSKQGAPVQRLARSGKMLAGAAASLGACRSGGYRRARCFSHAKLVPAVKPHTHSNGARATTSPDIAPVVLAPRQCPG